MASAAVVVRHFEQSARLTPDACCRDAFDAVYGASAGAINATYFLTGQREGVDIYAEDIANKTFCDLGRLVGRHAGAPAL